MKEYTFLIIDDCEDFRYILSRSLAELNIDIEIYEAEDGLDAYQFLKDYAEDASKDQANFPPLVFFIDINMPIMNGFEFIEEYVKLKKIYHFRSSALIMFSSSDNAQDKAKAKTYKEVNGYIVKGNFTSQSILELLHEIMPDKFETT